MRAPDPMGEGAEGTRREAGAGEVDKFDAGETEKSDRPEREDSFDCVGREVPAVTKLESSE